MRSTVLPRAGGNPPTITHIAPSIPRMTLGLWILGSSFTRVAHIRLRPPYSIVSEITHPSRHKSFSRRMMECHTMPLEATSRTPMANHCTSFTPHVGYLIPNVSKHRPYCRQVKMEIQPPSITWARSPQAQALVQAVWPNLELGRTDHRCIMQLTNILTRLTDRVITVSSRRGTIRSLGRHEENFCILNRAVRPRYVYLEHVGQSRTSRPRAAQIRTLTARTCTVQSSINIRQACH